MADERPLPHVMQIEAVRLVRVPGWDWDHEIHVALPTSYERSDLTYPVLWVTDASLLFRTAVEIVQMLTVWSHAPEMVVVGVSNETGTDLMEFSRRRGYDFSPSEEPLYDGLGGSIMRRRIEAAGMAIPRTGGGPRFLDFLIDELRPRLASEYRMDPDDHALFGHSAGGMFAGFALFARPGAFAKYICGSPSLYSGNFAIFDLEEEYAAGHSDLPARVFFGAGETEVDNADTASSALVGSMVRMAETLALRAYPSLSVTTRFFPGETHLSVPPLILSWGIRTLWSDGIRPKDISALLDDVGIPAGTDA